MNRRLLNKIFKSKFFLLAIVSLVILYAWWRFTFLGFLANPVREVLTKIGLIAVLLYALNSFLPFLVLITPKSWSVAGLKVHRRLLGWIVFGFVLLHAATYFSDQTWEGLQENLTRPYIIFGLISFFIFFILTLTSNDWSVKKFGKKAWSKVHWVVYALVPLLIYHTIYKDKGNPLFVAAVFGPLVLAYIVRIGYYAYKHWPEWKNHFAKPEPLATKAEQPIQ